MPGLTCVAAAVHSPDGPVAAVSMVGDRRTPLERVAPLVVAHTLLDVVAFVGYALVAPHVDWL